MLISKCLVASVYSIANVQSVGIQSQLVVTNFYYLYGVGDAMRYIRRGVAFFTGVSGAIFPSQPDISAVARCCSACCWRVVAPGQQVLARRDAGGN